MHQNPNESVYSSADHAREPLKYPACSCGAVWQQRGNRTGHCTACGRTWEGVKLFDAHQRINPDGSVSCIDPTSSKVDGSWCRLVDGSWRGRALSEDALARIKGI